MPQPAWMTRHLTWVMLRVTRTMIRTVGTDVAHDYIADMETVEATYTDDELQSAWREDSDYSAEEDPQSNIR